MLHPFTTLCCLVTRIRFNNYPGWISPGECRIEFTFDRTENPAGLKPLPGFEFWYLQVFTTGNRSVFLCNYSSDDFDDLCTDSIHISCLSIIQKMRILKLLLTKKFLHK